MATGYASKKQPRTKEEALEWFHSTGTPVNAWARAHGFPPAVVYALLAGRTRGRRGAAHHAAVALGLKAGARDEISALRSEDIAMR